MVFVDIMDPNAPMAKKVKVVQPSLMDQTALALKIPVSLKLF
jgi:hypothetical protein